MRIFRKRPRGSGPASAPPPAEPPRTGTAPDETVRNFLRAQNLEQLQRYDEAAALYEQAVEAGFDSAGPYDRLIAIYRSREAHRDIVRVASAALEHVRTFDQKRAWYDEIRREAEELARSRPDQRGAEF